MGDDQALTPDVDQDSILFNTNRDLAKIIIIQFILGGK